MISQAIAKQTVEDETKYRTMEEMLKWQLSKQCTIQEFDSYIIDGKYVVVHRDSKESYYSDNLPTLVSL